MNILQVISLSNYGKGKIKLVGKSDCKVYGRETNGFSGPYRARETINLLSCKEKELAGRCLNVST
jgi:hypothetical protein